MFVYNPNATKYYYERTCKICGEEKLLDGFCYNDGEAYYCSEDCLHQDFTPEEWQEIYNNDEGYWTQWEESDYE